MLLIISNLACELKDAGIRYCHWKSNWALGESIRGETDLDLLVRREDMARFRVILTDLGFRSAIEAGVAPFPSAEHYHALDPQGDVIAHVHAYYRVVTGQSLSKNYRLPIEEMLLGSTHELLGLQVPARGAELITFTIRMMLKHTSIPELIMLTREWKQVRSETEWLLDDESLQEALRLLPLWIPQLSASVFVGATRLLAEPGPMRKRIAMGFHFRRSLRGFTRHGFVGSQIIEKYRFARLVVGRLRRSKRGLTPLSGGVVIAFVGSEASGKTTTLKDTATWLGGHFTVKSVHVGQPRSSPMTLLPNLLLPMLRSLFPHQRSGDVEARRNMARPEDPREVTSFLFAVRSFMVAKDRHRALSRAHGQAANGTIVLCDRYPSSSRDAPDGPQLGNVERPNSWIILWLARREASLYREIRPPDLAIHLTAPLDVVLERNAIRTKVEPEAYVRMRHTMCLKIEFNETPVLRVDTARPQSETREIIRDAIWSRL